VTVQLEKGPDGLRARLSESEWAAAQRDSSVAGVLAPLDEPPGAADAAPVDAAPIDAALVAAVDLALGGGPVHVEMATGAGDRGVVAQLGCDATATAVAVRALVPASDGSGPVAVPGVEVGLNEIDHVMVEMMRLLPPGGQVRHAPRSPLTMPHELALTLHQAVRAGDDRLARLVAEQAGFDAPPDALVELARGTTASATVTVRVAGSPTTVVQQWLLCDAGWVLLTVRGALVTHTVHSRDEVRDSLAHTLTGAFAAAAEVSGRG
jgi:hypothetical protein